MYFEETIGGGDENNLLCHDQEGLEETRQLRSLGEGYFTHLITACAKKCICLSVFSQELSRKGERGLSLSQQRTS